MPSIGIVGGVVEKGFSGQLIMISVKASRRARGDLRSHAQPSRQISCRRIRFCARQARAVGAARGRPGVARAAGLGGARSIGGYGPCERSARRLARALRLSQARGRCARSDRSRLPRRLYLDEPCGKPVGGERGPRHAVLPREMVPPHLTPIAGEADLPSLHDTEIALIEAAGLSETAHRLAQHVVAALESGS